MSVSFTHVVKVKTDTQYHHTFHLLIILIQATEVIFVLAWSYGLVHFGIFNRAASVSSAQLAVIFIITFGVIIASLQEATFSWHGLIFGLLASIQYIF